MQQAKENDTLFQILQVLQGINAKLPVNSNEETPTSFNDIVKDAVSMHVGDNDEYDGVLIRTLDHEFIIGLDEYFKKSVTPSKLKGIEQPWRLPTRKEAITIILYASEINVLLDRFGNRLNDNSKYWIEPLDDAFRCLYLIGISDVLKTTSSTSFEALVRCVKDVEPKKTNNNGSGTCC